MPRASRKRRPGSRRSARDSRNTGGRRAATSKSTFAGRQATGKRYNASRKNSSRCSLILSFRQPRPPLQRCCNKRAIPIVFALVADPIGSGFVASFPRPGGNATGFINFEPTIAGKWLELLKEIAPRVNRVAILFNPVTAPHFEYFLNPFKAATASFGVEAITAPVRDTSELESVIAAQAPEPNSGLIVMPDSFTTSRRVEIISLAARYRLPVIYPYREFAEVGGLLSYGLDRLDNFRRAATYADRILKGEKPSELPVQAPVKFELVINLKTAKALGLDVPPTLLARADEVIE